MFEVNNVQENGEKGFFSSRTAYLRSVWVLISHLPITILVMFICIVNHISDLVWPLEAIQVYSCQRHGVNSLRNKRNPVGFPAESMKFWELV